MSNRTPSHEIVAKRSYDSVCSYLLSITGKMDSFNNDKLWFQVNRGVSHVGRRLIFIARTMGGHAVLPLNWLLWEIRAMSL